MSAQAGGRRASGGTDPAIAILEQHLGDCRVDLADLSILAADWLACTYQCDRP